MSSILLRQFLTPRLRARGSFPSAAHERQLHRRPKKKIPPPNPLVLENEASNFNSRLALKQREDAALSAKKELEMMHGYLSNEAQIQKPTEDADTSYAKVLKSQGFPKIKRIHGWEKKNKDLRVLRELFTNKTIVLQQGQDEGDEESQEKDAGEELIVLEGKRLINEALEIGLAPQKIVSSKIELLKEFPSLSKLPDKSSVELFLVPYQDISRWSDLSTSPGFMFSFKKKDIIEKSLEPRSSEPLPMTLILDKIRNPDNLGGILRVAAAAGCKRVIATKGCVNIWSPKVIRAAAGAHFHLPITSTFEWDDDGPGAMNNVLIADMKTTDDRDERIIDELSDVTPLKSVPYFETTFSRKEDVTVIIGGETEGVSQEAKRFASEHHGRKIYVPLFNKMDSLNVLSVSSVILFHVQKEMMTNG